MWRNVHILVLCLGAMSAFGERARTSNLKERTWVLHLTGNWTYANSAADSVDGAVYSQKFSNPIVGAAGLGREVWQKLYLGFRYEYWYATRKYTLGGVETRDRLDQQAIGLDVGYRMGSPRVYWLLLASAFYPLTQQVKAEGATNRNYDRNPRAYYYEARLMAGVKFNNFIGLILEGGYRYMNFGDLQSGGTSYLGQDFSLSGAFLGAGVGFHF